MARLSTSAIAALFLTLAPSVSSLTDKPPAELAAGVASRLAPAAKVAIGAATLDIWLVQKLMDAGLLTVAAGPKVIRWLPPMNTTEAEVREGLRIMREVLGAVGG